MSLFDSASALELDQLLHSQRASASLFYELVYDEPDPDLGAAPVPLRLMWQGYEVALAGYSIACCATLVAHGVNTGVQALDLANTVDGLRANGDPAPMDIPPWLSDVDVLSSHRSNLMRRWPTLYKWRRIPRDMPYLWPVVDEDGGYKLKVSKYDRKLLAKGERNLASAIMERVS